MFWWIAGAGLIALAFLIIASRMTIHIYVSHIGGQSRAAIKIRLLFGLIKMKREFSLLDIAPDDPNPRIVYKSSGAKTAPKEKKELTWRKVNEQFRKWKSLLQRIYNLHGIIRQFFLHVRIHRLIWSSRIGMDEASATGIMVGAAYSFKDTAIAILRNYLDFRTSPTLSVQPSFEAPAAETAFECMASFRIGNAMWAGVKIVKQWRKGRAGLRSDPDSPISKQNQKREHSI